MNRLSKITLLLLAFIALCACGIAGRRSSTPTPESGLPSTTPEITAIPEDAEPAPTPTPLPPVCESEGDAIVHMEADTEDLGIGDIGIIYVKIDDVCDLYGAEIHLHFDPQAIEIIDADPQIDGIQIAHGDLLMPQFVAMNQVMYDQIDYAISQMSEDPVNGSGIFTAITFRVLQEGLSSMEFTLIRLAALGGIEIPFKAEDLLLELGDVTTFEEQAPEPELYTYSPDAYVFLDTGQIPMRVGRESVIFLKVSQAEALRGVEAHLNYDAEALEIIDMDAATDGVQVAIGDYVPGDFVAFNKAGVGYIDVAHAAMGELSEETGGVLYEIHVKALKSGYTSIRIENLTLSNDAGEEISASYSDVPIDVYIAEALVPGVCGDDGPTGVLLQVPDAPLAVGDFFYLSAVIENGCELDSADIQIAFDPAMFRVLDASGLTPGIQGLNGSFIPAQMVTNNYVNDGLMRYEVMLLDDSTAQHPHGILCQFRLEALKSGEATFSLPEVRLHNGDGSVVHATTKSLAVDVLPQGETPNLTALCPGGALPVLRMEGVPDSLAVGETAQVSAIMEGACDISRADIFVRYDPYKLAVLDSDAAEPGIQTVPGEVFPVEDIMFHYAGPGVVVLSGHVAEGSVAKAQRTLFTFTVVGLQAGEITLDYINTYLTFPGGYRQWIDGERLTLTVE